MIGCKFFPFDRANNIIHSAPLLSSIYSKSHFEIDTQYDTITPLLGKPIFCRWNVFLIGENTPILGLESIASAPFDDNKIAWIRFNTCFSLNSPKCSWFGCLFAYDMLSQVAMTVIFIRLTKIVVEMLLN